MFVSSNRGKRSIALDLKQPAALEAMRRLIAGADVLVQNFRPGTMERLGLDEPAMRALRAPYERAAGITMRCEEIFARCDRQIEVVGPLLEEEGLPVHQRFWPSASGDE